ncbi:hypothetical protein F4778DRAFT_731248 [Xylariomycetidae sp. FL2044]|nr:hypothetical protein F4778DRAFT_731248 [Xylariomycetidae sp. FL2044]
MDAANLSGEQIAAMAYALPPFEPRGLGRAIEVVAVLMGVIVTVIVGLRLAVRAGYSRLQRRTWGIDDYLVVLGFLPYVPSIVFSVYVARFGTGSHDVDLPSPLYQIRAGEYIIYWELHYFISSTIIKCAIGCTCIRLDPRRRVRYPILINMAIILICSILAIAFVFANCRPFAATWNPALGSCQTMITLETVSYIISGVQMATDWVCAGIPVFVVAQLQMPRRQKYSAMVLLGIGLLASIATCIRMPYLRYYDHSKYTTEFLYHAGTIVMCSNLECSLGLIACSLPPLRALFKFYYGTSQEEYSGKSSDTANFGTKLHSLPPKGIHLASVRASPGNGSWDRLEDDDSSRKGIMRKTEYHVTSS